ncbi:HD-GYP domain-containing protein [Sutcliffiella cohnii]|uniref:HD-GYP domain-containing protein n=1 Tax=Sutcliffiella cohnii TaxID=33932 RepID=UPI00082A4D51|nr:HD-GYP domain-containing protein [Sutcliffiella cohnii]
MVVASKLNYVEEGLKLKSNLLSHFKNLMQRLQEHNYTTYQHSIRVGSLLAELGFRLGFSIEKIETLYLVGILHDIGKIKVSNDILNKKGKLTHREWEELKRHVQYGVELLNDLPISDEVVEAISGHHENEDGSGYPYGLDSNTISLYAKMVRIVDSYDAMIDNRPYRNGLSKETAIQELQKGAGKIYEPHLVHSFCQMITNR